MKTSDTKPVQEITKRVAAAVDVARMGTDTLSGLRKIDRVVRLYESGLISEDELLRLI